MMRVQEEESFVFIGDKRQRMKHAPRRSVRTSARAHCGAAYEQGRDYEIDYDSGEIYRMPGSRIPDWIGHPLYGVRNFDHTEYGDYSNREFTVYVTYEYEAAEERELEETSAHPALVSVLDKLQKGDSVALTVLGDSISTGAEASEEGKTYFGRLVAAMSRQYPLGRIAVNNRAINGETSEDGIARLAEELGQARPDLVIVGFGMNDQNKYEDGIGVPLPRYKENMTAIIETLREAWDAAVVVLTPCAPNPLWKHSSGDIGAYAEALRAIGKERGVPVADAHRLWMSELEAGKTPESLLLNNINHPNDYGHRLYYEALKGLFEIGRTDGESAYSE